ncbi:hypothetical protein AB0C13_13435 [Streptomyces sp. NPDC049099]|uniref:hypothetical protein n=1 Tax=Streptomyces sp. NPDC049099 TaxID=3155768 RepID=UPI00341A638C
MSPTAPDPRGRPFTLVVCAACRDAANEHVMDVLRRAVRACPHGVMVSTGCLDQFMHCRTGRGVYAAVQPCVADRRPTGAVVRLGPLASRADAEAVAAWLHAGMPADAGLPESLRAAPAPRQVAHLN